MIVLTDKAAKNGPKYWLPAISGSCRFSTRPWLLQTMILELKFPPPASPQLLRVPVACTCFAVLRSQASIRLP